MTDDKMTIDNLVDSIDNDTEDSTIREAAKLLVTAMTDWPTPNQTNLTDFLREFRVDFGDNFDSKGLQRKTTKDNWKNEAQASIVEMLDLYPSKNLNDVVNDIITKYLKK